jgi:hypothetical protein
MLSAKNLQDHLQDHPPGRDYLSDPARSFLNGHRPQKRSVFMAGLCRPKG